MTLKELIKLNKDIDKKCEEILLVKHHDYSGRELDALSNFDKQSKISEILGLDNSPKAKAMNLVILKQVRWCELVFGDEEPLCESIDQTEYDMVNYVKFSRACRIDEKKINE